MRLTVLASLFLLAGAAHAAAREVVPIHFQNCMRSSVGAGLLANAVGQ